MGEASNENKVSFARPPKLQELNRLLRIVIEEMLEYHIWPVGHSCAQLTKKYSLTDEFRRIAGSSAHSSSSIYRVHTLAGLRTGP